MDFLDKVVILPTNDGFELVGEKHCIDGHDALYGIFDTVEECYEEAERRGFKNIKDETGD